MWSVGGSRTTTGRIVALLLIGVALVGLGYLRFGPEGSAVSVPPGAQAGDLSLEPCNYGTEAGDLAAECGTLIVPESRLGSGSRLIALPVIRIAARSAGGGVPVFWLDGGPGQSNMLFTRANAVVGTRDVVMVGYRGVDGSVRLDCPEVESALKHSHRYLTEESNRRYGDGFQACADRFRSQGVDVTAYGLVQQVEDMEVARTALGYDRVDLLSQSAGTRTAMIYAWRHPDSVHRSVMLAVNPPGHFLMSPTTTDELIDRYARLCAQDDGCRARTDNLAASIRQASTDMPDRWLFLPIKQSNVRITSFYGLMESTSDALGAPSTIDALLSANEGDASGLWFASVFSDLLYPEVFVWGQYAAGAALDVEASRSYFETWGSDQATNLGYAATAFSWGGGQLGDAWLNPDEEAEYQNVRNSDVETLLISGALDFATPPQAATEELLPELPNGRQVVLDGFGHVGSFWRLQPEAGTRLITTYLDTGQVDQSLYTPQRVDFSPSPAMTTFAKLLFALMVGLSLVTIGSLVWMARRVHRRGPYGRVAGALLRSVHPIVLGLGGWFAGALFVLTFLPGVSLDNTLLAVVGIGVPVGLGIFLAWTRRDPIVEREWVGPAVAMLSALVGAWLGFSAAAVPFGLTTAIIGAIAVTNLVLMFLPVPGEPVPPPRERQVRAPLPDLTPTR